MQKLFMSFIAICLYTVSLSAAVEGTYSLTGYDPYAKLSYTGTLTITKGQNEVYFANWIGKAGNENWSGKGNGFMVNDQLSFIYQSSANEFGLQQYKITGDHLEGPFVLL